MTKPRGYSFLAALFVWTTIRASLSASAQPEPPCVDPRSIRIIPYKSGTALKSSAECRVWSGVVSPCDAFRLSPGVSAVWIEDRNVISLRPIDVRFDRKCGTELAMPVVAAGLVSVKTDASLQLVHIAGLEQGLDRAIETTSRVLMPLGPAVAVAIDQQHRPVAVSRPFTVRPEGNTELTWKNASVPAVVLTFDIDPEAVGEPFELVADGRIRPDVLMTHRGRHMAIWYGLTAPNVQLTVDSRRVHMQPVNVATNRLGIADGHGSIRPLPALTVNVTIPLEVRSALDKAVLRVFDAGGNEELAQSEDVSDTQRFATLPPKIVKAMLDMGSHELTRTADLTAGDDKTIDFELEPYVVSGVVSYGDERAKARIEFRRDESVHTRSDASGRYEIVLWEGGKYVAEVKLDDVPDAPSHLDLVDIDRSTTTLDFRVPRAEHRVRVLDDQTGSPIARAMITVFNSWDDPVQGARKVGRNVATGSDGEVLLPGLRPGTAVVHVSAEGYHGAEPVTLIAGPGQPSRTIEIRLRPREAGRRATVLLPNGSPASGARLSALSGGAPVWSGKVDQDGSVGILSTLNADVLLASHPAAGLLATRWVDGAQPLTLTLPTAAAPVVVKALRSDGSAAPFAPLTIWLNGLPINDPALTVFTGSIAATDAQGVWIGRSLPPTAFRVAVVPSRSRPMTPSALESFATVVPFPWPSVVTVRTID